MRGSHSLDISPNGIRRRRLCASSSQDVWLTYRPAEGNSSDYEYTAGALIFLLCGGLYERIGDQQKVLLGPRHCYRRKGTHSRFEVGPTGLLLFSIEFPQGEPKPEFPQTWKDTPSELTSTIGKLLRSEDVADQDVEALLADARKVEADDISDIGAAPPWIKSTALHLIDNPLEDIGKAAELAGTHRVNLSRSFAKYFGISPSQFRLRIKAGLALKSLLEDGDNLSRAAINGGFSDQAHWSRISREATGVAPGRLQKLLTL